jgi:YqaJ-like viral recombinase domain
MIHLDVLQGSPEWLHARLGIPTASAFDRLITPKTGKPSAAADGYMNELLAEWLIGQPLELDDTGFIGRGSALESEAVNFYEALRDVDVATCGFCLMDDRRAGASPDRLIGEDGLLELKCPAPATHVGYVRALREPKPMKYYAQIQGQLLVTGRVWVDFMSYHPMIRPVVVRFARDEAFLATLQGVLTDFCDGLEVEKAALIAAGYEPALEAA